MINFSLSSNEKAKSQVTATRIDFSKVKGHVLSTFNKNHYQPWLGCDSFIWLGKGRSNEIWASGHWKNRSHMENKMCYTTELKKKKTVSGHFHLTSQYSVIWDIQPYHLQNSLHRTNVIFAICCCFLEINEKA